MADKKMSKLIMVINDTQEILELFEIILTGEGFRVSLHSYQVRDLKVVKEVNPDLLIVDQLYGEEALGWELVQKMKMDRDVVHIPIVVCSTEIRLLKELEGHLKAKNIGVILKPFDVDDLVYAVKKALSDAEQYHQPEGKEKVDKDNN